jgi:hypothetical protein
MKTLYTFLFLCLSFPAMAQVGINNVGAAPHASAMLDISSTNRGLLVPRMTMAQRNAIVTPATGLMIFQTDNTPGYFYNAGTPAAPVWSMLGGTASPWLTNGSYVYYNSGNVGIGTNSPTALLHAIGTGTGQGNILFAGAYKAAPGNPPTTGVGTRMMWYPDKAAFRVGYVNGAQWDKSNIGDYSVALGFVPTASGNYSVALGANTTASGENATAIGYSTIASNKYATAMGVSTKASGEATTVTGVGSEASGYASAAMGFYTKSSTLAGLAIGRYNVGGGAASSWVGTDPIFEIGIGSSTSAKQNALTVLKNGRIGIGIAAPRQQLSVGDYLDIYSGFLNAPTRPSIRASSNNNLIINAFDAGILYFNLDGGTGETRFYNGSGSQELMHISAAGNVGIGTGLPQELLHVRSTTGTAKTRLQSIDRSAIEFYDNTKYRGAIGFDNFNGYLYLQNGGDVVLRNGNLGIGTISPTAKLDVNGSVKVGPAGSIILEIREITGSLEDYNYGLKYLAYPSGYNVNNTRVLSCQVYDNSNVDFLGWRDITEWQTRPTYIYLYEKDGPMSFRLILMKL